MIIMKKKRNHFEQNNKHTPRNLIAILLVLFLSVFFFSGGPTVSYAVQEAEDAAKELYDLGLFLGVGKDASGQPIFELERPATRHEAITILVRLLGREEEAQSRIWSIPFSDVDDWAKPYVGYAYANGLTKGVSSTEFDGKQEIDATQFLTFVLRALGYTSGNDYEWNRAWELTDQLEITHGQYANNIKFTRGDVAIISRNALSAHLKDQETTLFEAYHQKQSRSKDEDPTDGGSEFEVHYIDVGQGDSALILCDGHAMLVDGGLPEQSSRIYSYLQSHGISHLDYIVCSHPHQDHAGGLAGALNYATAGIVYCSTSEYDGSAFANFKKYLDKQNIAITVPAPGDAFTLGSATAVILGPLSHSDDPNKESIVFRIQYGETSFLFTGDAKRENEIEMIDAGCTLKSTVLKVGHHGSETSTSYPFLYYVEPEYAVISVGENNPYGHPTEETLSRLRDADVTVYRTDENGTIICRSDGKSVAFTTEKSPVLKLTLNEPNDNTITRGIPEGTTYVLNTNTHKFHYPDCSSVSRMSEKNKSYFKGTREEVIAMGYLPCGQCNP